MNGNVEVFHHLPFENGCATVVPACAPWGRYGARGSRYEIHRRICRVVLFRDGCGGRLAEQACFFGTAPVMAWITSELGALRLDRLAPRAGVDAAARTQGLREALAVRGLLAS